MNQKDLIPCGFHRIQKLGRIAPGEENLKNNGLKEGDVVEVFLRKKEERRD